MKYMHCTVLCMVFYIYLSIVVFVIYLFLFEVVNIDTKIVLANGVIFIFVKVNIKRRI